MLALLLLTAPAVIPNRGPDPKAVTTIDQAIARMGGETALRRIGRARFDFMTQWLRISFDRRRDPDILSFEQHTDLRDYTIPAWRNTRRFVNRASGGEIIDVVRDTVAIRAFNGQWAPLSVAYVDERREVFAFSPERLLLEARDANDARMIPDSTIDGVGYARVTATIDRFPATLFFRRADQLLAMARFRAGQPNDFGLAPWGNMEVEWRYSRWQKASGGVTIPMQWDIRRVGQPYKRMSVLAARFDSVVVADSFAVSDSLRQAFAGTATRPMHDTPLDSARIVEPGLVSFGSNGYPVGAVKLGRGWLLVELGQAPFNAERAARWIEQNAPGTTVTGGIASSLVPGGGAAWLAENRKQLHLAPSAQATITMVLRNHGRKEAPAAILAGKWIRADGDSLWLEPIDLPDAPGSLVVYSPALKWAFSAMALAPTQTEYLTDRLRSRGWEVDRIGSFRALAVRIPPRATTSP